VYRISAVDAIACFRSNRPALSGSSAASALPAAGNRDTLAALGPARGNGLAATRRRKEVAMSPDHTPPTAGSASEVQQANGTDDPFRYGWRYVKRVLPDGTVDLEQMPLTLEDVLHPQEEDHISYTNLHVMLFG
jgi:hypothetical protein